MKVIVTADYEQMSAMAADFVYGVVQRKPDAALGFTTGNTPVGMYRELAGRFNDKTHLLRQVQVYSTEEYLGIGPEEPRSLFAWLRRMIGPCGVTDEQITRMEGESPEPQLSCESFEREIAARGGLDLLVEGIGLNGHLGFNEPGSAVDSRSRIVALERLTQDYNVKYWNDKVPEFGMTIGLGTMMEAGQLLLIASGEEKAKPLALALTGPITQQVPASLLQRHKNLTVIADRQAASLLPESMVISI